MDKGYINAQPLSYLLTFASGEKIFFGGDTSIHSDLKLYGELYEPHLAILDSFLENRPGIPPEPR